MGQVLKDIFMLPRPKAVTIEKIQKFAKKSTSSSESFDADGNPIVYRLERHYETEYGLPSTHAMNALQMPWFIMYLCAKNDRYSGSLSILVMISIFWTLSCTLSRLYLGVHSMADIWSGLFLGAVNLVAHVYYGEWLDNWLLEDWYNVLIFALVIIGLVVVYPKPKNPSWVSSPGDTTLILAVGLGVAVGCHLDKAANLHNKDYISSFHFGYSTIQDFLFMLGRSVIGFGILVIARTVAKFVGTNVMLFLFGEEYEVVTQISPRQDVDDKNVVIQGKSATYEVRTASYRTKEKKPINSGEVYQVVPPKYRYNIELPTKMLTYSVIGFLSVHTIRAMHQALGWKEKDPVVPL